MPLQKEHGYTIHDIYALPEGKRAELIDGQIYDMAPPSRVHQKITTKLASVIDHYISEHRGKCESALNEYLLKITSKRLHSSERKLASEYSHFF